MSFKERLERAFPVWKHMLERPTPFIRKTVADGGAAGPIAVTGIKKGDQLVSVMHYTPATSFEDLSSEFIANTDSGQLIRTDGFIDNTDGTATTADKLIITWIAWAE